MNNERFDYCKWCGRSCQNNAVGGAFCPTKFKDWEDVDEFEARVIKFLLIEPGNNEAPCWYGQHKPKPLCVVECGSPWLGCKEQRLKWARLQAESEMEGEMS